MKQETITSIFIGIGVLIVTILTLVVAINQFDPGVVYNCDSYYCVECLNCNPDVLSQFSNKNTLIALGIITLVAFILLIIVFFMLRYGEQKVYK